MLTESDLPVTEIAAKVGYENPNKFTSAFKNAYGIPPMELRKSARMDRLESSGIGNHSDLMQKNGLYRKLVDLQTASEK